MEGDLPRFADPQQPACQARIAEIELGGLDQPFVLVAKMGAEQKDDVACLQYRQPRGGCVVGDAAVGSDG